MSRLPSVLKMMNTFGNGESFIGQAQKLTPPKLVLKTEDFVTGFGSVKLPTVLEALDIEHTYAGPLPRAITAGFGSAGLGRELLRWVGSYQDQDTGRPQAHELVAVGTHLELEFGDQEVGSKVESKAITHATYFKWSVDGQVRFEIDVLEKIFVVDGVDRYAEMRAQIGL
ncbi:phage major tail tube protein [Phenylobacterium sp.]|uniref:phage major tail tube protein n=1 Tax=Phenylobacterium sp. TaxID=1871053 RepID=UPI00301D4F00